MIHPASLVVTGVRGGDGQPRTETSRAVEGPMGLTVCVFSISLSVQQLPYIYPRALVSSSQDSLVLQDAKCHSKFAIADKYFTCVRSKKA